MTAFHQIVDIPEDRHLTFIVPEYVKTGRTEMQITFLPADFLFEEICRLEDHNIQCIIKNIESSLWVIALQTASTELKERIFANMSNRAAKVLQEDIEFTKQELHKRKMSALNYGIELDVGIEDAQLAITRVIRKLMDADEITHFDRQ